MSDMHVIAALLTIALYQKGGSASPDRDKTPLQRLMIDYREVFSSLNTQFPEIRRTDVVR